MAERTLIIIKPDGVQRLLVGEIIGRFEKKGLKIVAAKLFQISKELAEEHYQMHRDKPFFRRAVDYVSSAPVLLMVLEGERVIEISRRMMGATFGYDAEPGTVRGDFGVSKTYNLIHGSDSPQAAQHEIKLYFKPEEIINYELNNAKWL